MNIKEQLDETKQELYFSFRNSTYDNFPYVTAVGMILVLEK